MPMVNPLVMGGAAAPPPPAEAPAGAAPTAPSHGASGFNVGNLAGGLTHPDNTSVHVACVVTIAFGVILLLHFGGFRFAVDAGVAGGGS